jgi:hypothetical protein
VGFSGRFAYSNGGWAEEPAGEPSLVVDLYDSDIATIEYRPAPATDGTFFLGYEPRVYFEDEGASSPVDVDAEAEGFAAWAGATTGRDMQASDVRSLMAHPDGGDPPDTFVEDTVEKLLVLAGLPLPRELTAAPGGGDGRAGPSPERRRWWGRRG